jgi:hypothetical protein
VRKIKPLDVGTGDEEENGVLFSGDGGRVCALVEAGDLGDRGACALDVDDLLAAIGSDAVGADGALDDHIEAFCVVPGQKKDLALTQALLEGACRELVHFFGFEVLKEWRAAYRRGLVDSGHLMEYLTCRVLLL